MDCKVIKSFIDKNTGIGYNEGNTFSSDDTERVSFLAEKGYIKQPKFEIRVDETLLEKAKELKIKGYTKMTKEELEEAIKLAKEGV